MNTTVAENRHTHRTKNEKSKIHVAVLGPSQRPRTANFIPNLSKKFHGGSSRHLRTAENRHLFLQLLLCKNALAVLGSSQLPRTANFFPTILKNSTVAGQPRTATKFCSFCLEKTTLISK
jgi:hypothetical protein